MTPERWQQINQIYQTVVELQASQRSAFLDRSCAADEELRREVESLLASHEQASKFIETPALEVAAKAIANKPAPSMVGREIGSYKIVALLGVGGMGEVYRAKDSRLGREVAVKILPSGFSTDADRQRRFEQEARAAGRLNHPNVLAIYDVGTHEGSPYIVSELLEGETLRDRIEGTALPPRKAMEYALQIARGLAAAHEKGIVHRDLKPENLFLTKDGRIKILDFGLAKLRPKLKAADTAESTRALETASGIVMGTAGYMAPEQVRGEETDHRSDLFSFGTILYEMLSGRRAFQGKTGVETMSAISKEELPELSKTNPNVPTALEHIVRRCLEKTPEQRFQAASDLAFDLEELLGSASWPLAPAAGQPGNRERLAWIVAAVLLLVVLALAAQHFHRAPVEAGVMRFIVPPPEKATFAPLSTVAVSPDGRQLAFAATSEGKTLLWVRPLDSLSPRALPGTEGAAFPFWSPDSRSIGFFAQGKLKRIEASGEPTVALCRVNGDFGGGTWNHDGVILFSLSREYPDVLYRVSSSGGPPTPVTTPDPSCHEVAHSAPQFLPDGHHFLYHVACGGEDRTNVGSLDTKEGKRVMDGESVVVYAPPGYLLFVREGVLQVQPFDAKRLEITADPIPVAEQVQYKKGVWQSSLSVSENGVLAYEGGNRNSQLLWVDREGRQLESIGEPAEYVDLELSPDGKRAAIEIRDRQTKNNDIWLFDLLRRVSTRLTFALSSFQFQPAWSPDGSHIVYTSYQKGAYQIQQKMSNGAGNAEVLIKGKAAAVSDWSWDGRFIVYECHGAKSNADLWILPLFGDHKPFPFLQTEFDEYSGRLSPNGRWMAYTSNETGRAEVYVQSFPLSGAKWQVSTNGGDNPRWRRDGKELFYLAADQKLMAAAVNEEGTFKAGVPKVLFQTREVVGRYRYAVTADGQRFLVNTPLEEANTAPITVVLNWTAELGKK